MNEIVIALYFNSFGLSIVLSSVLREVRKACCGAFLTWHMMVRSFCEINDCYSLISSAIKFILRKIDLMNHLLCIY